MGTEPRDYLVISDLHLRGGFSQRTERAHHFDQEFADFLRHYRLHRTAARPWTLIIGGDLIEFHYVTDLPEPDDPLLRDVPFSPAEVRYGPGTEAAKSRWKLDRILRSSHPQLLLSLARFVAEGNEIVLLRGNHDTELVWPEAQEHFRRLIAEHHPADVGYLAMKQAVAERLRFAPWFWYVPGELYVEHGCQYDPFCSFEYFLYPVVPTHPTRIENSISDLSIRYFTNQLKVLDAMAAEGMKSVAHYVRWLARRHRNVLPQAIGLYAGMVRRILAKSGPRDARAEAVVRAEHERRLAAADAAVGAPPGSTAAIHALHATPLMRSLLATARFLDLDLFAAAGIVLAVLVGVSSATSAGMGALAAAAVLGMFGGLFAVGRNRIRYIFEYGYLSGIAARIAARFGVRYVVLGHSHKAGDWPLSNGSRYVNVGTWVPSGRHACFVYFVLAGDAGARHGGLWRWNKEKGEPEPFATTGAPH